MRRIINKHSVCNVFTNDFLRKHTLFYSHSIMIHNRYYKIYPSNNSSMVCKMAHIHNWMYPQNPYNVSSHIFSCVSQSTWDGFMPIGNQGSVESYQQIGVNLARFHNLLDMIFPNQCSYPTTYDNSFFNEVKQLISCLSCYGAMATDVVTICNYLEHILNKELSGCLGGIHGDFHTQNILTNGFDIRIIDFDMIGYGSRYLDLAVLYLSINLNPQIFRIVLDAYLSEKPIQLIWRDFMDACFLSRTLCICTNIFKQKNYSWLPIYIKKTAQSVFNINEDVPSELECYFYRGDQIVH